jgi:hypothetical protein
MTARCHGDRDLPQATDPLQPLTALGVRVQWVSELGTQAVYLTAYRVLLLDAALSRSEAYAVARRMLQAHLD